MARNQVKVSVLVSDDGTIQLTKKSASKLNTELGRLGVSAHTADRNLKGVSKQSANATKNFSKMQQGIGDGLVPIYATLAAQIFAISAAFRFLQDVGNLRTLQEGQMAYASSTGTALRSLSKDVIEATDHQIKFAEASQAVAIGTAAGLGADQLTRLGKAAKDASIVLGRDVTDSFNRLVKGATKAEPELLDELGIILRLEEASAAYATQMGITGRKLTAFERSQAVTNDILEQAETKYGKILEISELTPNAFNVLAKSFDDLINKFKEFLQPLESIAIFLAKNPFAVLLTSLRLIAPLFKPIIGSINEFSTKLGSSIDKSRDKILMLQKSIKNQRIEVDLAREGTPDQRKKFIQTYAADTATELKTLLNSSKAFDKSLGKGIEELKRNGTASLKVLNSVEKQILANTGAVKKLSAVQKAELLDLVQTQKVLIQASSNTIVVAKNRLLAHAQIVFTKIKLLGVEAFNAIRVAAVKAVSVIQSAFARLLPWVGGALLVFELLPEGIKNSLKDIFGPTDKVLAELEAKFEELNKEYKNFIKFQEVYAKNAQGIVETTARSLGALSNMVSSMSTSDFQVAIERVQALNKSLKDQAQIRLADPFEQFQRSFDTTGTLDQIGASSRQSMEERISAENRNKREKAAKEFFALIDKQIEAVDALKLTGSKAASAYIEALKVLREGGEVDSKELLRLRDALIEVGTAANNLPRAFKETTDAVKQLSTSLATTTQFSSVISIIKREQEDLQKTLQDTKDLNERAEVGGRLATTESDLAFFRELESQQLANEQARLALTVQREKAVNRVTGVVKELIGLGFEERKLAQDILEERIRIANIETIAARNGRESFEDLEPVEKASIALAQLKILQLEEQTQEVRRQLVERKRLEAQERQNEKARLTLTFERERALNRVSEVSREALEFSFKERELAQQIAEKRQEIANIEAFAAQHKRGLEGDEEDRVALAELQVRLFEEQTAELQRQAREREKLAALEDKQADRSFRTEFAKNSLLNRRSSRQKELIQREIDLIENSNEQAEIRETLQNKLGRTLQEQQVTYSQLSADEKRLVNEAARRLTILQQQADILKEQKDIGKQIVDSYNEAVETSLKGTFFDLIVGDETSLRRAVLKFGQDVLRAMADTVAGQLTDVFVGLLQIPTKEQKIAATIENSHLTALRTGGVVISDSHLNAINVGAEAIKQAHIDGITQGMSTSGPKVPEPSIIDTTIKEIDTSHFPPKKAEQTPMERALKEQRVKAKEPKEERGFLDTAKSYLFGENKAKTRVVGEDNTQELITEQKGIFTDFAGSLKKLFSGEAPFLKGLMSVFKDGLSGFGSLFSDLLSNIFGSSGVGGGGAGSFLSTIIGGFFGAANGAMAVGGFRAFANGAPVISKPTVGLVGEGRFNEAIVPLPDGKSIPVIMNGSQGETNTNIQINIEGGQVTSESIDTQSEQARALGKAVSLAVQRELQKQARPGGMLSPYGVAR